MCKRYLRIARLREGTHVHLLYWFQSPVGWGISLSDFNSTFTYICQLASQVTAALKRKWYLKESMARFLEEKRCPVHVWNEALSVQGYPKFKGNYPLHLCLKSEISTSKWLMLAQRHVRKAHAGLSDVSYEKKIIEHILDDHCYATTSLTIPGLSSIGVYLSPSVNAYRIPFSISETWKGFAVSDDLWIWPESY